MKDDKHDAVEPVSDGKSEAERTEQETIMASPPRPPSVARRSAKEKDAAKTTEDPLPVGQLAWTREEEPDDNTEINLSLDLDRFPKQPVTPPPVAADEASMQRADREAASLADRGTIFARIPRWVWRVALYQVAGIFLFTLCLALGYGLISGDASFFGVFRWEAWAHAYELIFG